jgi:MFS family permease
MLGQQMQSVTVGWELYERTSSAIVLGNVGLVQVLPVFLLALPAGQLADRLARRNIILATQILLAICSFALAILSYKRSAIFLVYVSLLLGSLAKAFNRPASDALLPQLVPAETFSNAVFWNRSASRVASMAGPALAGLVIAIQGSATLVYILCATLSLLFFGLTTLLSKQQSIIITQKTTPETLFAGVRFVWQEKILLAAITLDFFATLLGGAYTLLPIFAKDILHVGAVGLGWLRAAPSIGGLLMTVLLIYLPPIQRIGKTLLWTMVSFGVATIIFGLSRSFWLSLLMLVLIGFFDNLNVVVRHTLVQLRTPDFLRGRVSAMSNVFISSSIELGGFESGLTTAWFGPIVSVVGGGFGTLIVVLIVALLLPEIRQLDSLKPRC